MFGLEILDVVLGLAFVYLLLSLVCSAINEYVASVLNLRGKALIDGIEQLLDDANDPHLRSDVLNHRLIRSMYTRSVFGRERPPSYIPARSFAMALLDAVENPSPATKAAHEAAPDPDRKRVDPGKQGVRDILDLLKDDALGDVVQSLADTVDETAEAAPLPAATRRKVASAVATSRTELQKLHDSVEVWFNNAMDRVSGAYKRRTQMWLFCIGLLVAVLMNADTVGMWRQLSSNQQLRDSLAKTAVDQLPGIAPLAAQPGDTVPPPNAAHAKAVYDSAMAQLDRSQLRFGWTAADAQGIWVAPQPRPVLRKLLGLFITAVALSLGAPFWFDVLNKIVNIRAAGRAPNERPKNPEAPAKRMAEVPTK